MKLGITEALVGVVVVAVCAVTGTGRLWDRVLMRPYDSVPASWPEHEETLGRSTGGVRYLGHAPGRTVGADVYEGLTQNAWWIVGCDGSSIMCSPGDVADFVGKLEDRCRD